MTAFVEVGRGVFLDLARLWDRKRDWGAFSHCRTLYLYFLLTTIALIEGVDLVALLLGSFRWSQTVFVGLYLYYITIHPSIHNSRRDLKRVLEPLRAIIRLIHHSCKSPRILLVFQNKSPPPSPRKRIPPSQLATTLSRQRLPWFNTNNILFRRTRISVSSINPFIRPFKLFVFYHVPRP